jgi:hypothetical protein
MRNIRDVLRLHEAEHLSSRAVGIAVGLPRTTVRNYIDRARKVGLHWPLPDDLDDRDLEERLFGRAAPPPAILRRPEPDWAAIHAEMRRIAGGGAAVERVSRALPRWLCLLLVR